MPWTDLAPRAVGYTVTAANWNEIVGNFDQMQTWTNYTPAVTASTNPTLGDGAVADGHYLVVGDTTAHGWVLAFGEIVFGTADVSSGSGNYSISLPVTGAPGNVTQPLIGGAYIYDSTAAKWWHADCVMLASGALFQMLLNNSTSRVGAAAPMGFDGSDGITFGLTYRI